MSQASRTPALAADAAATRQQLDGVVDTMPGLHGPDLNRQARRAVALVNAAADLDTKIRLLGRGR